MPSPAGGKPGDGRERRRVGRHAIRGVQGTLFSPGDVEVLDVGTYGLQIEAAADLPPGSRHCLELRHGGATASVEVAVRWSSVLRMIRTRDDFVPLSRAGVEFRDVLRDDAGGIWEWILPVPGERD